MGSKFKMNLIFVFSIVLSLARDVTSMISSKSIEGYLSGYLSDCPGSNKPAIISKDHLKYLTLTVQGPVNRKRNKYDYHQMKQLAKDPNVNFQKKTFVFVTGYLDSPDYYLTYTIGLAYKSLGYNVLLLDYSHFTTMTFPSAVRLTRPTGYHVAEMFVELTNEGLDPSTTEFVGISLGAHTMGFIAKNYREFTGKNFTRLTALDPAGPCFRNMGPADRLDHTDADFVDIINTNIDGFGMAAPIGHVNFYVNGGEYQPGSPWIPCTILCSHLRCYFLWIASLYRPNSFIALQCDSVQQARNSQCYDRKPLVTNLVGPNTDRNIQGIFYLATENKIPFFMGTKGLKKENDITISKLAEMNSVDILRV